jgi:hypothetical protein
MADAENTTNPSLAERLRQTAQGLAFICMGEDDPPSAIKLMADAADRIERIEAALRPFAEPHAFGDSYVRFAPRLIEAARAALKDSDHG